MTFNQKISEADKMSDDLWFSDSNPGQGWFYHAPARPKKNEEPADYPAMSQIPGLTEEDALPPANDMPRPLFRDTDTKYIRMAKQGGRQNLLIIKENSAERKPAVGYPRNDWFYLADNDIEDQEEKEKLEKDYAFLRPEYMVHEAYQPEDNQSFNRPGRGPIGFDRMSAFERDGKSVTDKTVKLPELRKPGYGVRSGKPLRVHKQDKNKPPSAQTDPGRQRLKYLPLPSAKDDKARISKLLAYGYDKDWHEQISAWQGKQDTAREKIKMMTAAPPNHDNVATEYNSNFSRRPVQQTVRHNDAASERSKDTKPQVKQTESQRLREANLIKPEERTPFKMTRFKNIAARTETHRPLAQHAA